MIPISQQVEFFNRVYESWKSGVVHVNVQFVSILIGDSWVLMSARVELNPFELAANFSEVISTSALHVGTIRASLPPSELDDFMASLKQGKLRVLDLALNLADGNDFSLYAPISVNEPEYFIPRLEITSDSRIFQSHQFDYMQANSELRCAPIPFDGLADLLSFFDFGSMGHLPQESKISIRMLPPCDLKIESCWLSQNRLHLDLLRRVSFKSEQISIGLRQFPHPSLARRKQIGAQVSWSPHEAGFEFGVLEIDLDDCATAEVMLSADGYSVRRWFLLDPHKSLNPRLTDYRYLDPGLSYLKKFLTAQKEARQLEVGTAALLHLLGANCLNPPSTETLDVIAETPGKRLALIECTTRVDNIREKTAKLVHRRDGLISTENKYDINRDVMAILVVNQPLSAIANDQQYLQDHQVVLLTLEDIDLALLNLEIPPDLDKLFTDRIEMMRNVHVTQFNSLGGANRL